MINKYIGFFFIPILLTIALFKMQSNFDYATDLALSELRCRYDLQRHIRYLKKDKIDKKIMKMFEPWCLENPYKKGCKCEGKE